MKTAARTVVVPPIEAMVVPVAVTASPKSLPVLVNVMALLPALSVLTPVTVSDPTDGHLIHLAGLNLTRAWTMLGIASALTEADVRKKVLLDAAAKHAEAGLGLVATGHYEGDHWLGSFAVYLLSGTGS